MKRILLVDDELEQLVELRQRLVDIRPDWSIECIDSGVRALEKIKLGPYDVVVSDLIMPRMDGVQLLEEISRQAPAALRIILSGQADWSTNLRLMGPAHQYVTKPCEPEALAEIIERSLGLRDRLAEERLKLLVTQIKALPTIPSLYMQLLDLLRSEHTPADKVAEVVAQDLAMCTKLLQLVNSAFFGLPQPIVDPTEAVIYLGVNTIKSLVLSLQVFSLFERVRIKDFSFADLWEHSWQTGALAKRIAEVEEPNPSLADHAFTAGLLHDIGKLVLGTGLPNRYQKAVQLQREKHWLASQAEMEVFGSTHAEVGAYLLGLWGLPHPVIEAVAMHHLPNEAGTTTFTAVTAVHAANGLAHQRQLVPPDETFDLELSHFEKLGLTERLAFWREQAERAH